MSLGGLVGAFGEFIVVTGATGPTGPAGLPGPTGPAGSMGADILEASVYSINSTILSSATSSIGCTIPSYFQNLRGICHLRSLNETLFEQIGIRFNDDTGNNYGYNTHYASHSGTTTSSGSYAVTNNGGDLGLIIGNVGMTGTKSFVSFEIPFYTGTNNYKNYTCYTNGFYPYGGETGNSAVQLRARMIQGIWMSTSPITKISLYQMSGGLFEIESSLLVHGEL